MLDKEQRERLHRIFDLVLDIQEKGIPDAFFDFSGHCGLVDVRVFKNGWKSMQDADIILNTNLSISEEDYVYLDDYYIGLDDMITKLEEFKNV